jgi:sugar O-acyltransferase (sialic acid O-acetyltransferase NeuD family)
MKKVLVLGADPQARIIPDILNSLENLELMGFVEWGEGSKFLLGDAAGFPVFNGTRFPQELMNNLGSFEVIIAMSRMEKRKEMIRQVKEIPLTPTNIIHPSAIISKSARIGRGCLIAPGVIIGPGVELGDHIILNSAVTIDHDTVIQENVIMGSGVHLPGYVKVLSDTFIGVGSCSVNGVTIGRNCLIGAGSVITKNITDDVIAAGVPAKEIRKKTQEGAET